ncbi:MAG: heme A synthase, partial [Rhodoluna sp.]
ATTLLWYSRGAVQFGSRGLNRLVTILLIPFGLLTILIGILVTGAGPHAGDADTPRNGLDIDLFSHLHSYPAYLTLGLAFVLVLLAKRDKQPLASVTFLLGTLIAQAAIGVIQTRLGLPIELVGLHMLGASMLAALLTWQFLIRGLGARL